MATTTVRLAQRTARGFALNPSATDRMRLGAATRQRVYKRGRSLRNFDQLASIIAVGPFSISKVCRYEGFDLALLDARLGYCP
jgi:hypothetical protein